MVAVCCLISMFAAVRVVVMVIDGNVWRAMDPLSIAFFSLLCARFMVLLRRAGVREW